MQERQSKMEENQMDKITTEFAEFICDHICKYAAFHSQELLDNCCDDCPMESTFATY